MSRRGAATVTRDVVSTGPAAGAPGRVVDPVHTARVVGREPVRLAATVLLRRGSPASTPAGGGSRP